MSDVIKILTIAATLVVAFVVYSIFHPGPRQATTIVGRTITIWADAPAETLKLSGKPYAVRDTVWRDSIHFIIAKDSSFIDTLIDRTRPFGTKGQTKLYRWDIVANPMSRMFDPFIIDGLPQPKDTTFSDTTVAVYNTDAHWLEYSSGASIITIVLLWIIGAFK